MHESPPASSAELSKWLREARDAQTSMQRQAQRMGKALSKIEKLTTKGSSASEAEVAPGSG